MSEKFCLTVQYDKESPDPEHIFYGVGKLLEAMKHIDKTLSSCIDSDIQPVLLLEDVERGSIRLWLRNQIADVPDDALKNGDAKKFIGHYLVKAKYWMLRFLDEKSSIEDIDDIEQIEKHIVALARETEAQSLDFYQPPVRKNLLDNLAEMGEAMSSFRKKEVLYIETFEDEMVTINKDFRLSRDSIDKLCEGETIANQSIVLLKVKQPDFLGDSQWIFRHGERTLKAKMEDDAWMQEYRNRKYAVYPGDSLRVQMQTLTTYGSTHEVIDEKHSVVKVLGIVPAITDEQITLNM